MHENLVKLLLLVEVENSVLSKACFFKKLCANNKENSLLKNKDNFLTQNMTKAWPNKTQKIDMQDAKNG